MNDAFGREGSSWSYRAFALSSQAGRRGVYQLGEGEGLFGQLLPDGKGGGSRTAVHAQFVEDMHQVAIHSAFANHQRVGDFLIA